MRMAQVLAQAVLASSGDAIIATDRDGVIRFWNPGAERIFDYRENEAIGQSLDLIIPERLRARHWSGYRQFMETGRSRYGDGDLLAVPGVRKDGVRISLEFTIVAHGGRRPHRRGCRAHARRHRAFRRDA